MSHYPRHILAVIAALLLMCGCSQPHTFKVQGEIQGAANTNLYIRYYGDDAVRTDVTAARDGHFDIELSAARPTILELLSNDMTVLARMYVCNGDELSVVIDRQNPLGSRVTGNEANEQWSAMINDNARLLASGDADAINAMIQDYIAANPDNVVGALMFATFYDASSDPARAMQVFDSMAPEVRDLQALAQFMTLVQPYDGSVNDYRVHRIRYRTASRDSIIEFRPRDRRVSLIALSNENSSRMDSVVPALRGIYRRANQARTQMLDLVLYSDTNAFKRVIARDSAAWIQGWVPGGLLARDLDSLAVTHMPFYIVTDSLGRQLYRGASLDDAEKAMNRAAR